MRTARFLPVAWALELSWRGALCLLSGLLLLTGYALTQNGVSFLPAPGLPLTELDRAVPFWPWTVWIYNSLAIAVLVAWFSVPDAHRARLLFFGLASSGALCAIAFALFPTHYPRELYPLVSDGALATRTLEWVRRHDSPSNCFPSLHVALAFCLALTVRDYGRKNGQFRRVISWGALIWAALLALSTLTTKQHFVVDVVGGIAVGATSWALARWATNPRRRPLWTLGLSPIQLGDERDRQYLAQVRQKLIAARWTLEELRLPAPASLPPLSDDVVRFLSQVIYVEEIAGQNFALLATAARDDDLRAVYSQFAEDERRHAAGLRTMLEAHGQKCLPPGLGTAMLLHHFDRLNPEHDADALLVALAIPVFETFLDAGTIPFLRRHPALQVPGFEALVERICRDEAHHLAVNWIVCRQAARTIKAHPLRSLGGLRLILNPAVWRGAVATPFLALDVYANAKRLGFDLRKLEPSFRRIFWLHRRHPELSWFPPWFMFRLFAVNSVVMMAGVLVVERISPSLLRWLAGVATRLTGFVSSLMFEESSLLQRVLPEARGGS